MKTTHHTIKPCLWALGALLLFSTCSKEAPQGADPQSNRVKVSFSAPGFANDFPAQTPAQTPKQAPAQQKAQQEAPQPTSHPSTRAALSANTTVRVVAYTAAAGNPVAANYVADQTYYVDAAGDLAPCTVDAAGGFVAADPTASLALPPATYDFYAVTPALPLEADKASVKVPNGADYATSLTASVAVSASGSVPLTRLARKCAQVTFVIRKATDNTAVTALAPTPGGSGLVISKLPATAAITLGADIPSAAAGSASLTLAAAEFVVTDASTLATSATTLLLPLDAGIVRLAYDLTYTASGTTTRRTVSGGVSTLALASGKSYTLTLTIKKSGISISVTDWSDGGSQDTNMGQ